MKKIANVFNAKVRIVIGLALLVFMIGFTQVSQSGSVCKSLIVKLDNTIDNYFLDEDDIVNIATINGDVPIENQRIDEIQLKQIETRLRSNPYIRKSEIYKDLEGNMVISVELERPIVRILRSSATDAYITSEGNIMPVSDQFVSRVMLVSGATDSLVLPAFYLTENGKRCLEAFNFIHDDDFLRAQIAEMEISRKRKAILFPQISKQRIEFGELVNLESKFRKLRIFYKEILPRKGWNTYERVNLEFENEIIAQ